MREEVEKRRGGEDVRYLHPMYTPNGRRKRRRRRRGERM